MPMRQQAFDTQGTQFGIDFCPIEQGFQRLGMKCQRLAIVGEPGAMAIALQNPNAQTMLKHGNALRQGRLRDIAGDSAAPLNEPCRATASSSSNRRGSRRMVELQVMHS
jgi:hypothetical protein